MGGPFELDSSHLHKPVLHKDQGGQSFKPGRAFYNKILCYNWREEVALYTMAEVMVAVLFIRNLSNDSGKSDCGPFEVIGQWPQYYLATPRIFYHPFQLIPPT